MGEGMASGDREHLMEIVGNLKTEYSDLNEEEKQSLVEKLQAHQESKSKGWRINMKLCGQDIKHTLHHVAVEVSVLDVVISNESVTESP